MFTKEEQKQFDKWSKEQIYEAYLLEVRARKQLNIDFNRLSRLLAQVRYTINNEKGVL